MPMWTISLPLSVAVSPKREFVLNLNHYRNAHFQVLAKAKVEFARRVAPLVRGLPRLVQCSLEYTYYHGKGKAADFPNVCVVHDKFFEDVLVGVGIIQDDSQEYVRSVLFLPGGKDLSNPRVEVVVKSHQERKCKMKFMAVVTGTHQEAQQAFREYFRAKHPSITIPDDLQFGLTSDGGFETRVEVQLDGEVKTRSPKAKLSAVEAAQQLNASLPAMPAPVVEQLVAPASPSLAAAPAQEEPAKPAAEARANSGIPEAPPLPSPAGLKNPLFGGLGRVTGEPDKK